MHVEVDIRFFLRLFLFMEFGLLNGIQGQQPAFLFQRFMHLVNILSSLFNEIVIIFAVETRNFLK